MGTGNGWRYLMAGKSLGPKRVLKTQDEKEHSLENELIKLYKYLQALFERILGRGTVEDVEKMDNIIYIYLNRTKKEISRILIPIVRWIQNQKISFKFNVKKRDDKKKDKKKDKIVLKRR